MSALTVRCGANGAGEHSYRRWSAACAAATPALRWGTGLGSAICGQAVKIAVPGSAASWQVDFYDTKTGADVVGTGTAARQGETVTVVLPDFVDDIAFVMRARE